MRFDRYYKGEFADTERKRAAAQRHQRKEIEAFPLFSDEVKARQPSIDSIMESRKISFSHHLVRDRLRVAKKWRFARYCIGRLQVSDAKRLLAYWNSCCWPGTPVYLLMMINMFHQGRLLDVPNVQGGAE